MKPIIAEYTDAGPGVGVKSRFAELAHMHLSNLRIQVHRAPEDSGQNEVERTNSYIGIALVDGAALNWQHYDEFHGLTGEDVQLMRIED